MPLYVLGCTRATLMHTTSIQARQGEVISNMHRDGDRSLQL
jgi:hypothetical protein